MMSLRYPVVFWMIALIPHMVFLLPVFRYCKRKEVDCLPWMGASFVVPFIAIPSLFARFQPESRQQWTFWRLCITFLILDVIFFAVARLVDVA
jgi:hypothetical protein